MVVKQACLWIYADRHHRHRSPELRRQLSFSESSRHFAHRFAHCRAAAAWLNCRSVRAKDRETNIYFEHPTSDPKWSSKFFCLQRWTPAGGVGGLGYIAGVKLVFRSQKVAKLHAVPDRAFNMSNHGQYCNTLERATLNQSSLEDSLDSRRRWIDTG